MELERGSRLGRYNIRGPIGQGGMGVVYRALDEQLGRYVAIKTIQGDKASDREYLARFKREALAISRIDDPHIVKLLDFVEARDDQPSYMVMEFLHGRDLARVIKDGPLLISRAVDRILEVCAAVTKCHRFGYIHRDLKPTNIFLAEYNQIESAKVLDFGATKQEEPRDGRADDADLTQKGTFLGTPFYMAPEQITGKAATAKSDQYSLGVVLYTALTGSKPFDVSRNKEFKDFELLQAIKRGDCVPVRQRRPEIPAGLEGAIHKAMSVPPNSRFLDLHAFGAELRTYASPQAQLTWEAHFTSGAPVGRDQQGSVAIVATPPPPAAEGPTTLDPTLPPPESVRATGPTVAVKDGRPGLDACVTGGHPDSPSASISSSRADASRAGKSPPADAPRVPGKAASAARFRNRPALMVAGLAALLAFVLTGTMLLAGKKEAFRIAGPPPGLFVPPLTANAPTPSSAGVAPHPLPRAAAEPVAVSPAPASTPAMTVPEPRHHAHTKPKRQMLDQHGIPIPTD